MRGYRPLAVYRLSQRVDYTAHQSLAYRDFQNAASTLDGITFGDVLIGAHNHCANGVAFEVEGETESIAGKFQHLALHYVGQTMNTYDTVSHRNDGALGTDFRSSGESFDSAFNQFTDFRWI